VLRKARSLAGQRKWRDAAATYADLLRTAPTDDGEIWFEFAAIQLLAGDAAGYRKSCDQMKDRCGKSPKMRGYHVARAYTLGETSDENLKTATRLSADELRRHGSEFWSLTQQGALLVRVGRCEDAPRLLEQSLSTDPAPGRAVLNWLWLAIAHQKLGLIEDSKRWIAKAAAWTDDLESSEKRGVPMPGYHLHNYLEASILSREVAPTPE
jgi:hypothetical protein